MNSTIDYIHKGTFAKINLVNNSFAVIFHSLILVSMILMKSIDSYTNLLIILRLVTDIICYLTVLIENIIDTWFIGLNKDALSWILFYSSNYSFISIFLLIYHRFRLVKYPFNENEIICFKKICKLLIMLLISTIITTISIFYIQFILFITDLILFFFLPIIISIILLGSIVFMLHLKSEKLKKNCYINNQSGHRKKLKKDFKIIVYLLAALINLVLGTCMEISYNMYYFIFTKTIPNQRNCDCMYYC